VEVTPRCPDVAVAVADASAVAAARRAGADVAAATGYDETAAGRLALVVTEAATNLLRHAGGGTIVLRRVADDDHEAIEVVALDRGPGMTNVQRCLEDGYSSRGTLGTGLGAIRRAASVFDVYSAGGQGTALLARVAAREGGGRPRAGLDVAGIAVPKPGEDACGDAWTRERRPEGASIVVADGLGHGLDAARAAAEAIAAFLRARGARARERLEAIHAALRGTRGAAVAVADVDAAAGTLTYAALGNVSGIVWSGGQARHLVSHNGTAGHGAARVEAYRYPWDAGATLIMHSDGLATPRRLDGYPGLFHKRPALIAGVLYRDLARGTDDVAVVVARAAAA